MLVEVSRSARREDLEDIALHEAVHVKQFVEQVISGELDDETEAYFTTYAKNAIMSAVDRYFKTQKEGR